MQTKNKPSWCKLFELGKPKERVEHGKMTTRTLVKVLRNVHPITRKGGAVVW